ncbi:nuclear transport factor 2 family protein [Streptomyces canus]|uniref:nuclear transport factor 2 family protein n=1 Tax=Streptomyces canus TaxID=58343 RepID=UPI0033A1DF94
MAPTMPDERVVEAVADAFARIAAEGDVEALRALYTDDARVWHNTDDTVKTVEESLVFFEGLLSVTSKRWYEDVRLARTATGYVDQHYMCAMLKTGEEVRVSICAVVTLEGERVKRVDEYIESGACGPVTAALMRGR